MAIVHVTSGESEINEASGTTTQYTIPITLGTRSNGGLICKVQTRGAQNVTAISATWNGNAMTSDATYNPATGYWLRTLSYAVGAGDASSRNLVVTFTGRNGTLQAQIEYQVVDGFKQTSAKDQNATATGTSGSASVSITPTENDELIIGQVVGEHNTPPTSGQTQTQIFDGGGWFAAASYFIQTTAAAKTMDWSSSPDTDLWYIQAVSYKAEPGSNSPPTIALNTADASTFSSTTPTVEFTGSDTDSDDLRYNIQISDNPDAFASGSILKDNFQVSGGGLSIHPQPHASLSTWQGQIQVDDRPGQSWTAKGGVIDKIRIRMSNDQGDANSPDGTGYIRVYTHAGTFGTSSAPLNDADPDDTPTPGWLAISDAVAFTSAMSTTPAFYDFAFSGSNRVRVTKDTKYVFIFDWQPANRTGTNTLQISGDSLNSGSLHAGNSYIDGQAAANNGPQSTYDLYFEVYETFILLDKVSGTHAGFANTVTGGDTDPFNAGEKASYTVQGAEALSNGATYYWRVRTTDPNGTNTYSDWSASRSFTIQSGAGVVTVRSRNLRVRG